MHEMRYYARLGGLLAVLAGASLAACGSSTNSANDTLPPIASTTTTTVVQSTTTTLPATYTIKSGDSLFTIAQMFGLTSGQLAAFNGIVNKNHIEVGQVLKIPKPGETTSTVASTVPLDPSSTTLAP